MAVDALGAERVRCVMLPFRYTSQESLDDAAAIAARARRALRHRADRKRRERPRSGARRRLSPARRATSPRRICRRAPAARILMAISNKFGADGGDDRQQVGNVGRLRHALRRHERRLQSDQGSLQDRSLSAGAAAQSTGSRTARSVPIGAVIPENVITRPPTAELRENQTDQDTLPPYDVLDQILERLVEREEPCPRPSSPPASTATP